MKKEILHKKISRYLDGQSMPAETRQIQNWLAVVDKSPLDGITPEEKEAVGESILNEIKAETAYPLFYPRPRPWWQSFSALF